MNPKVDWYFNKATQWKKEIEKLRIIILDCQLEEELKWGVPCYTYDKSNIALIHVFKEYCALLFVKGALLDNSKGMLIQQTSNVQSARQIRFRSLQEIVELEADIKASVYEAIAVEKAGLKVKLKTAAEFPMVEEFRTVLNKVPRLKTAFYALTPGRQRAYLLYFSAAKQSRTRQSRVEKYTPQILDGKGLDD